MSQELSYDFSRETEKHISSIFNENLPDEIKICTMNINLMFDSYFDLEYIANHIELSDDGITSLQYNDICRPELNKTNSKKKIFKNCIKFSMTGNNKYGRPNPDLSLYKNGKIEIRCKSRDQIMNILKIFIGSINNSLNIAINDTRNKLKHMIEAINGQTHIKGKNTISHSKNLSIDKIMFLSSIVNCRFKIDFNINLSNLYGLLTQQKYDCIFDSTKNSCLSIRYKSGEKFTSIFVVRHGSVIIAGARKYSQINTTHKFIHDFLITHRSEIQEQMCY